MTKPSEIFDTPKAFSRVGGNEENTTEIEEVVKEFGKLKALSMEDGSIKTNIKKCEDWLRTILTTKDQEKEEAIAKARDQEAKLWFETWYSHYISPTKPLQGEFAMFATERIQMTGYERDQALPTEDNK